MENRKGHSLFWPIILVGIGITWLLVNLGYIPAFNLGQLLKLWPIILIVMGIDIIFGRRFPWAGTVIGLLAVAGIITFLVMSPNLGLTAAPQMQTETFTEPIGTATSAKYYIEASSAPVDVSSLTSDDELVNAVITHRSIFNFDVSGTDQKTVRMSETTDSSSWLTWDFSTTATKWDVQLAEKIPTEIILDGGSGSLDFDLSEIELTSLRSDMGSGASKFVLPVTKEPYDIEVDSGSGAVRLVIPDGATLNFTLSSGSGSVNVTLPANAALQIEVFDEGSGSLHLPAGLEKVSSSGSGGSLGVWQTSGFDTAKSKIYIKIMNQGSGSIDIHE
jgi:hypothetical protein